MSQVPARDLEAVFSDSGELSENIVFYDADGAEAETVKGFIETDGAPVLETDANIITVSVITATAPSIARGRYVQFGGVFYTINDQEQDPAGITRFTVGKSN